MQHISISKQQAYIAAEIVRIEAIRHGAVTSIVRDAMDGKLFTLRSIYKTLSTIIDDRREHDYHASQK